jgi:regulator of protease activity HflC (stomatin/prohibitin superfamily)
MSEAKLALPSKEAPVATTSGWMMLVALIALLVVGIVLVRMPIIGVPIIVLAVFLMIGFLVLKPNESAVLTLFGRYVGTVRKDGFHWVNPFYAKMAGQGHGTSRLRRR